MKLKLIAAVCIFIACGVAAAQDCSINLSVLPMPQSEKVPDNTTDNLLNRLQQLVTADGVTADPLQGQFFITGKFNHITEDVTPGPPMQNVLHTNLTLYIGDNASRTVYATTTLDLRGVGTSLQRAYINALQPVNARNDKIKSFLSKGKAKVIDYFNKNYPSIIEKARRAAARNDYEQAMWLLVSIPECCEGYGEAYLLEKRYFQTYIDRIGTGLYNKALAAWSAGQDAAAAGEAFDYLVQIDPESAAYSQGLKLMAEIKASVKSDRDFEMREKYHDAVDLEKSRIDAIRQIGVAYGNGQQPTTTNLMWLR